MHCKSLEREKLTLSKQESSTLAWMDFLPKTYFL